MNHKVAKADVLLRAVIRKYMDLYNVGYDELAKALCCSRRTLFNRMEHPDSFRLDELKAIRKRLQIPADELREVLI